MVPIYDFGEIDGRLFVTMRLIKGHDLHGILARAVDAARAVASSIRSPRRCTPPTGSTWCTATSSRPTSWSAEDDFAYLIDFGIARAAGQTSLTSTAAVIGTWAYMAPERLTTGQTDPRADIYALTCVLYECLTGSQPFPGDSLEQQIGGHLALPPPRAVDRQPDVPAAAGRGHRQGDGQESRRPLRHHPRDGTRRQSRPRPAGTGLNLAPPNHRRALTQPDTDRPQAAAATGARERWVSPRRGPRRRAPPRSAAHAE